MTFTEEGLFIRHEDGRESRLDALYRNFELFDLFNVPKQELMLYSARHNRVKMTPPPKASLEEKLAFALLHHHALAPFWRVELGDERFERLQRLFPETWIVDPRPLPPQATIADLKAGGVPVSDFRQLISLPKSERAYVVKPSGFSELAWGSRGVKIGDDLTREEWSAAIETAMASFDRTPWILQRFHKGKLVRQTYYDRDRDEIREYEGRVRLCPYYFVTGEESVTAGRSACDDCAGRQAAHSWHDRRRDDVVSSSLASFSYATAPRKRTWRNASFHRRIRRSAIAARRNASELARPWQQYPSTDASSARCSAASRRASWSPM